MTGDATFLLGGVLLTAVSGLVGVFFSRQSLFGQRVATAIATAGGACGLLGTISALRGETLEVVRLPSPIPEADFALAVDPLSAFFLAPVFLIPLLGAVFGLAYWKQTEHAQNGRKLRLFYGFVSAGMAILILASNSVTFLAGWEIMAVSAFFLVATEDHDAETRAAGWLYFAASHAATLSLFLLFAILYGQTGSYDLSPLGPGAIAPAVATAVFILALAGFGLKAGVMPLHFWLPSAHAMAPSHVSALMSGVLIKTGIYGLVRMTSLLPQPPVWWGGLVLALGVVSAVLGVAFALGQHDIKRLLAYHSIENIGIIVIGLGLALLGRALEQPIWIVLGLAGSLLHVWNHALFKSLLFFSAGSVIHARGTRQIDEMGGLAKSMPWTAAGFLIGSVAICGLPPLNGFVSEFLIYRGLFQTLGLGGEQAFPAAAFAVPALALMGALAVACFVKVFGVVFLGVSRVPAPRPLHESPLTMTAPLGVLAACCAAIGLAPTLFAPLLNRAVIQWAGPLAIAEGTVTQYAALGWIGLAAVALSAAVLAGWALLEWRIRSQPLGWTETWGCGYTAPTARMQYTASSLAQFLVGLFSWALRPVIHRPVVRGLFPADAKFSSHVPEVVLDEGVTPLFRWLARMLSWLRLMQQGSLQIYLLYIFAILVLLLFWH